MTRVSTLPSARDQAHRVLTLLGVPARPSLVVDVHSGLFDGDLTLPVLAGALRDEEQSWPSAAGGAAYHLCYGLHADGLAAARGLVALSTWPLERRIVTRAGVSADELTAIVRIAEFVAVRPGATAASARLLRRLAATVPGGTEAYDVLHPGALADAARVAVTTLRAAGAGDAALKEAAVGHAAQLDERQRLFGVRGVPHQGRRGGTA
jgi:hypothetical protein